MTPTGNKKQAVLLLSSGLDSAANLALKSDFKVELALTVDYGQRGATQELVHAEKLARHFGVTHRSFDFRQFSALVGGKSGLFGGGSVPVPTSLDDLDVTSETAAAVWVPNRNGILISIAAALAESLELEAVVVGFNAEEAATFPDNTVAYMQAMSRSLAYSTSNHVEVVSATAEMTKAEIVKVLGGLDFPFNKLWSCYHSGPKHCGSCESCQRLKRAVERGLSEPRRSTVLQEVFAA